MKALLVKHGLRDWQISVENCRNLNVFAGECLGSCDFENKVIRVDWRVGRQLRQTVLHEIAHALVVRGGHDEVWSDRALEVGCSIPHVFPYVVKQKAA